jgi:hypothetical protein
MLRTLDTHRQFEALARSFLAEHPTIRHEWRHVRNAWGGRTDLICEPGTANEVFASLTSWQITIGTQGSDIDFEDFGRNLSDDLDRPRSLWSVPQAFIGKRYRERGA